LIHRIPLDGRRPLAANRADLERLYVARADVYRLAQVRVAAGPGSVQAVVDRILEAVQTYPPLVPPTAPAT
jgi:shikimate kinase